MGEGKSALKGSESRGGQKKDNKGSGKVLALVSNLFFSFFLPSVSLRWEEEKRALAYIRDGLIGPHVGTV